MPCSSGKPTTGHCVVAGVVTVLYGRAADDVFALPRVTDTNHGYGRTFLSRIPLAQRVS